MERGEEWNNNDFCRNLSLFQVKNPFAIKLIGYKMAKFVAK